MPNENANGEITARHYATGQPVRLQWQKGEITAVEKAPAAPPNLWVAPPLLDLQVNGYGGIDFQQDNLTEADLLAAIQALEAAGCAGFLLTLITDEWPRLMQRLGQLRKLRAQSPVLQKAILGWHIEGPFLSAEAGYCGAHNPALMCDPKPEYIEELRRITGEDPVLLTLAPERREAIQAIAQAVGLGLKVSLGHTNAPVETILKAIEAGASGFTHLGNGCPRFLDRHDNILWRIFEIGGLGGRRKAEKLSRVPLLVSLIPDKIHCSPALFRLVHRVLGPESVYYTTDAMAAAGAPPGRYTLGRLELHVGEDQIVRLPGQPNFAGSALRPLEGVVRAAAMLGEPWQAAWPRFSEVPARFMGLDVSLRAGQPARFCVLEISPRNQIVALRINRFLDVSVDLCPGGTNENSPAF